MVTLKQSHEIFQIMSPITTCQIAAPNDRGTDADRQDKLAKAGPN